MNKDKDIYFIECNNDLSKEMIISLTNYYLPLIGKDSLSLYFTLYSDGIFTNFNPLSKLLNTLDIFENTFISSLNNLEEYGLVNTYIKTNEDKDAYIFVINMPKTTLEFCKDDILARLLIKNVSDKDYQLIRSIVNPSINKKEYKDITKPFDVTKTIDYNQYDEEIYKMFNLKEANADTDKGFNINKFLMQCDDFSYPYKARTFENNALIKRYADMYAITYDEMKKIVMNSSDNTPSIVNNEEIYFLKNKFINQMSKYKPHVIVNDNPYMMLPMHFLQTLQKDGVIPFEERAIVDYLVNELKFSNEITNCIIEYALATNNNKLTKGNIISLASPLKKFNVKTYDQAREKLIQINAKKTYHANQVIVEKPVYKKNDFELNDEEKAVYDQLLKGEVL